MERSSRYIMLVYLQHDHTAETFRDGLIKTITTRPAHLSGSPTWDQGTEMAEHDALRIATSMDVFFCDRASPSQRGGNENSSGLLRRYFFKGTDLSVDGSEILRALLSSSTVLLRQRSLLLVIRPSQVMATAANPSLGNLSIRRGSYDGALKQGWGMDRTWNKHNIWRVEAMRRVMLSTNITPQGLQYRLTAYAGKCNCSGATCILTDQRETRGIYDT